MFEDYRADFFILLHHLSFHSLALFKKVRKEEKSNANVSFLSSLSLSLTYICTHTLSHTHAHTHSLSHTRTNTHTCATCLSQPCCCVISGSSLNLASFSCCCHTKRPTLHILLFQKTICLQQFLFSFSSIFFSFVALFSSLCAFLLFCSSYFFIFHPLVIGFLLLFLSLTPFSFPFVAVFLFPLSVLPSLEPSSAA